MARRYSKFLSNYYGSPVYVDENNNLFDAQGNPIQWPTGRDDQSVPNTPTVSPTGSDMNLGGSKPGQTMYAGDSGGGFFGNLARFGKGLITGEDGGIDFGKLARLGMTGYGLYQMISGARQAGDDADRARQLVEAGISPLQGLAVQRMAEYEANAPLRDAFREGVLNFGDKTNPFYNPPAAAPVSDPATPDLVGEILQGSNRPGGTPRSTAQGGDGNWLRDVVRSHVNPR